MGRYLSTLKGLALLIILSLLIACSSNSPQADPPQTPSRTDTPTAIQSPPKIEPTKQATVNTRQSTPVIKAEKPTKPIVQDTDTETQIKQNTAKPVKPEPKPVKAPEPKQLAAVTPPPVIEPVVVAEPTEQQRNDRTLSGSIRLKTKRGQSTDGNEISSTFVYFIPDGNFEKALPRNDYKIATINKRFEPNLLAIPAGSQVTFPNADKIIHNVFSVSRTAPFDLGLYSPGEQRTYTFQQPGVAFIHCNVHHAMQADILVLETPWYTQADTNGQFSLEGVPNTPGKLSFWNPRAKLVNQAISSPGNLNNIIGEVEVIRPQVPRHLNKLGKPYRKERYKE